MRGVILAAGRGWRLSGVTGDLPKCLARVGSTTLVERQIEALRQAGITALTIVTGYRGDEVRRVCGPGVECLHNARFAATNSLYSLWLARQRLADGFVVLNCDVLFHSQLLVDLLTARYQDAVLVETRDGEHAYVDEEMKVRAHRGRVAAIAKSLNEAETDGENIGIAKFGAAGAEVLVVEMTRLLAGGAVRDWLPAAFDAFCRRRPLHIVESRGFPWIEIDCPEDYWRACSEVLPAIDAPSGERTRQPAVAAADERPAAATDTGTNGRSVHHV
jgi:choline kinase